MPVALTIAGGVLELVGLGLVFAELAVIRSREFGQPTPWAHIRTWWRRLRKRPTIVHVGAAGSITVSGSARARIRPGALVAGAPHIDRIARLERYVEQMDRDLDGLWHEIGRRAEAAIAEAAKRDDVMRREIEAREADRRAALRSSMRRQGWGAVFVLVGLTLGTLGNVL